MKNMQEIVSTKTFKAVFFSLASLLVISMVFVAGIHVGLKKAKYSYQWGANYERNFMGPGRGGEFGSRGPVGQRAFGGGPLGVMRDLEGRDFRNGHGVSGTIASISDDTLVIKDRDNKENTVAVTDKTLIKSGRSDIKLADLKTGENLVVLGNPGENGVINADIIRVFSNNSQTK